MSHQHAMSAVCVYCGSSPGVVPEYERAAATLGRTLAERGTTLVYGGACVGLMGVVADAALAAGGHVIGVIPRALVDREVAHPGLPDLRIVESMHERKALMADLSDGFIAMPGGWGTLEEIFETVTWAQLGLHRKPCGLLNVRGYFDPLLAFVDRAVDDGFLRKTHARMLLVEEQADALLAAFEAHRPDVVAKWIERDER